MYNPVVLASGGASVVAVVSEEQIKQISDALVAGVGAMSTAVLAVIIAVLPAVLGVLCIVKIGKFVMKWANFALSKIG